MALAVSMARSNVRHVATVGQRLGAVGVGALELGLAVPEPGEVERHVGRHPEQHDPATRARDAQAVGDAGAVADGVDRDVGARAEVVADHVAAGGAAHGAGEFRRGDHGVGAELLGEHTLVRVAGADDDPHVGQVAAEAGDRGESHRAGTEHGDDRLHRRVLTGGDRRRARAARRGCRRRSARRARPARRACRRGSRCSWVVVGDERRRPAAAGRAAEARSGCRARGGRSRGGRSRRRRRARRRRTGERSREPRGRAPVRG